MQYAQSFTRGIQMTTTNNLLTLPTLSELKLIGGYSGLNRPMKWVYSILSQPFSNWVNYGDLIFYNAAGRDTSEKMLISAVEEAHRCKLAGIIFLLDEDLLPSIPKSIGICADKLAFPVFTLPITSNINNIQHDIIMHIINNEEKWDKSTKFWSDLLFGDCEPNQDQLLNNAYHSDINPKMQFSLYLIQFCNVLEYCNMPVQQKQVDHPSSILSGFYSRVDYLLSQSLHEYWLINHQESCIVIMPVSSTPSDGAPFIKIAQELERQYVKAHIRISKGSLITDLKNIKKSYQEAQRAIYIEKLYPETLPFIDYSKLGFQRLLYEITDISLLKEYVKDTIGPLLEYDIENNSNYYHTLLFYYRNFKNIAQTAKQLNYHRNSMILRMQKIESILNMDFDSIADFYNIYVALEIQEYLLKIQEMISDNSTGE